jgi:hypothetical protein
MKLSIFSNVRGYPNWSPETLFDINGDDYTIHYTPVDAVDLYVVTSLTDLEHNSQINRKRNIQLEILDNFENQNVEIDNKFSENLIIINTVDSTVENNNFVYNDFLFNRTKAYYLGYKFRDTTVPFHYSSAESYQLFAHPDAKDKNKIFVAPNRVRVEDTVYNGTVTRRRTHYRKLIVDLLEPFTHKGYLGDATRILYGHGELPTCNNLEELVNKTDRARITGYNPPHNEYYRDTFISIYGESIEWGTTKAATEKTFDPLIKGHFILPFSACGFVQYLREYYNFKFPKFINYEYDTIANDDLRFEQYAIEVKRLLTMDIDVWRQHWQDNQELLNHNRDVFYNKPYDKIDFERYLG